MALNVTLNGESRSLTPPPGDKHLTVKSLLVSLGLDPAKIAVERNLEIVPRSTYALVGLSDGDRIEIVHFVGGG
jgi:thiazole synthase